MITKDFKSTEKEVQEALDNMTIHEINLTFNESKDCFNRMVEESKQARRIAVFSLIGIILISALSIASQLLLPGRFSNTWLQNAVGGLLISFILFFGCQRARIFLLMCHYRGYSLVGNTFRYTIEQPGFKNSLVARILDYQETTNDGYENNQRIYKYSKQYFFEVWYVLCFSIGIRFLVAIIESYIKN